MIYHILKGKLLCGEGKDKNLELTGKALWMTQTDGGFNKGNDYGDSVGNISDWGEVPGGLNDGCKRCLEVLT